jgi:multiple sugar transport system permease protein
MRRSRVRWTTIVEWVLIGLAALWAFFPFYWAFINSIKIPKDTFVMSWIPFLQFQPTLDNWLTEVVGRETQHAMLNSTVVAISAATLATVLGMFAAYSLARFRFHRMKNEDLTLWFLSQRIMPPAVVLIPFFLLMNALKLRDTLPGLILVNTTFTLPFAVVILRQMFKDLPHELEESALVDGCSYVGAFWRVALPLVVPGLVSTFIICLAFSWNEMLMALALTSKNAITMPVVILSSEMSRGVQFWYVGVRVLMIMLVPTIVAVVAQRYIVRGLTFGAIKG